MKNNKIKARLHIEGDKYGIYYLKSKKIVWCKDYKAAMLKLCYVNGDK